MEHLRIVKQKFSNKKNYFKKETLADGDFSTFAVFACNFIQNILSAKSICAQNFSKLVIREIACRQNDKKFSKFSTYSSYFLKFSKLFMICWKTGKPDVLDRNKEITT